MWSDDESFRPLSCLNEVVEALDLIDRRPEVDQQHMFPSDGLLDARNEHDPALPCVRSETSEIELKIVKGDRQGVETQ